jgi:cytochrome P450
LLPLLLLLQEDPLALKPSRWLGEDGSFQEASAYKFSVFNAGPRLCLGKPLAYLEVKIATLMLARSFDFEERGKRHDGAYVNTLTMPMRGGYRVVPVSLPRAQAQAPA